MSEYAASLVRAAKKRGPEGRMEEAKILRDAARSSRSMRSKDGTPVTERFFSKILLGGSECWYWGGHVDAIGYGRFMAMGENKAHRVAYRMFYGDIPSGMKVMHKCDTRCCVNPDHLQIGTQAENVMDMIAKGRKKSTPKFGEENPMAKASVAVVLEIRLLVSEGMKQADAARKFGLSPMCVSRIVRKESWK